MDTLLGNVVDRVGGLVYAIRVVDGAKEFMRIFSLKALSFLDVRICVVKELPRMSRQSR